ncbi:MAG: helix-turn-helix domain-containing protein [Actinomycetota bacterium]|jgi:DNA-binding transcriptional ArsR family regulator|nr:helix-turn-helix domain-containing protein [Actinomycetota bacterium]
MSNDRSTADPHAEANERGAPAPGVTDRPERSTQRITDPVTLRALAHPTRLGLLGLLRTRGPLTATQAADLIGESSASCSFHLRQLAKYGLIEEAGTGRGRERPWRAVAMFTDVPESTEDPELAEAAGAFRTMIAERYFAQVRRWLEVRAAEPAEWQEAAELGDRLLYLTAAELAELGEQVRALTDRYLDRLTDPARRPADARLVAYLHLAFPLVGDQPGDAR